VGQGQAHLIIKPFQLTRLCGRVVQRWPYSVLLEGRLFCLRGGSIPEALARLPWKACSSNTQGGKGGQCSSGKNTRGRSFRILCRELHLDGRNALFQTLSHAYPVRKNKNVGKLRLHSCKYRMVLPPVQGFCSQHLNFEPMS